MLFGVPIIDEEHQMLVRHLNTLYDAVKEERGHEVLEKVFKDVKSYADFHFSHEVELFSKTDYPDKQLHVREHSDLTAKLEDIHTNLCRGGVEDVSLHLMRFLLDWLIKHTQDTDTGYVPYLVQIGLGPKQKKDR